MRARRPNPCCPADEAMPDALPVQPASPAGKRARGRFATVESEASQPAASGSIAVSFAIVSFRNWPRRGL
ncbi:hypothetical protein AB4851_04945 [Burkholderia sp. 22PA0099]|uniref:hypothetical protein n=1 Tax=Burkholderia sp. 22PA0099 TaxID=3237372 RepID=UPI0039C00899